MRLALLVPFRDRYGHLREFVPGFVYDEKIIL